LDYEKNIKIVEKFFNDIGIELRGRFSEFKYLNMDACIKSAMNCANDLKKIHPYVMRER
jgi:UDP-galactopyranose mutase